MLLQFWAENQSSFLYFRWTFLCQPSGLFIDIQNFIICPGIFSLNSGRMPSNTAPGIAGCRKHLTDLSLTKYFGNSASKIDGGPSVKHEDLRQFCKPRFQIISSTRLVITSERAQRAERVLSNLRENLSIRGPTRPDPAPSRSLKPYISGTACLFDKRSSLMNTTWM